MPTASRQHSLSPIQPRPWSRQFGILQFGARESSTGGDGGSTVRWSWLNPACHRRHPSITYHFSAAHHRDACIGRGREVDCSAADGRDPADGCGAVGRESGRCWSCAGGADRGSDEPEVKRSRNEVDVCGICERGRRYRLAVASATSSTPLPQPSPLPPPPMPPLQPSRSFCGSGLWRSTHPMWGMGAPAPSPNGSGGGLAGGRRRGM